jgi:hypothetical protein
VSRWTKERSPEIAADVYAVLLGVIAIIVSYPEIGEVIFRGYFVQDADEVVRAWYGRCSLENPAIVPYSHLSMPGWAAVSAVTEGIGRLFSLPLTMLNRLVTVFACWYTLRSVCGFIRALGGSTRLALASVLMLCLSPTFFLMSLTVYPSVALSAVVVGAMRYWVEGRTRAAVLTIAWAPLIRWEGVLLVGLFGLFVVLRKRWRLLLLLLVPCLLYLGLQAVRYGNPFTPLAYRTTEGMGSWRVFNPAVTWVLFKPALTNLVTFLSPVVLAGGVLAAVWGFFRHRSKLALPAIGSVGLFVSIFSIWHVSDPWMLRVFTTPYVLAVLVIMSLSALTPHKWLRVAMVGVVSTGVAISLFMAHSKVNNETMPLPGKMRHEQGFHLFVRYADAGPVKEWLVKQPADWVIINHMNANLMRADPECRLYELPLRMGTPKMSLSRTFEPIFSDTGEDILPPGEGLVVYASNPRLNNRERQRNVTCDLEKTFSDQRMWVYRCRNKIRD